MTEIRNYRQQSWFSLMQETCSQRAFDVMMAGDYSLCVTLVLIFINKELVTHVYAKMIGLCTITLHLTSQVFAFEFYCLFF